MAELLTRVGPKLYRPYVSDERGKKVLYVQLKKALYGTLRAALLFWQRLTSKLVKWGFVVNNYDWCVANKTVNGKQCTILWHVDDLKISYVDPAVVTQVISQLEKEFGKEAPLTIRRGKVHDYLGMTLDYSVHGKVRFRMSDYIKDMLTDLPEDMEGLSATPAALHLFEVSPESGDRALNQERAEFFHTTVTKLLFL